MFSRTTFLFAAAFIVFTVILIASSSFSTSGESIGAENAKSSSELHSSRIRNDNDVNEKMKKFSVAHRRRSSPTLCVLPVGDSLTQGVATYRGYRAFLGRKIAVSESIARSLFARANISAPSSTGGSRSASITTVGSEAGTCVIGRPQQIFREKTRESCSRMGGDSDDDGGGGDQGVSFCFSDLLHEGHCSWHSRLLRERVTSLMFNQHFESRQKRLNHRHHHHHHHHLAQTLIALPSRIAAKRNMASAQECIVREELHNNQLHQHQQNNNHNHQHHSSSSSTRVPSISASTHLFLRVDVALLLVGHNNVFQVAAYCKMREGQPLPDSIARWLRVFDQYDSKKEIALLSAMRATPSSSQRQQLLCAWKMMRGEFAQHLFVTVEALLGGEGSVGGGADSEATRVALGLNPPTGFPILDAMLHAVIRSVVALKQQEYSDPTRGGQSALPRIVTASFPGFGEDKQGKRHTFDSTHPNDAGAEILAAGWKLALKELFPSSA